MSFGLNNDSFNSNDLREMEAGENDSVTGFSDDDDEIDGQTASESENESDSQASSSDSLIKFSVVIEERNCGKDKVHEAVNDATNEPLIDATNKPLIDVVNEPVTVETNQLTINCTNSSGGSGDQRFPGDRESEENLKMCEAIEERLAVGSEMHDLEQAYLLYCEYGRVKGFGVRRGEQRYFGRSEDVRWKEYMCSCAGIPDEKRSNRRVPVYKKLVMRSGCKAKIRVSRTLGSPWKVCMFEIEHNHCLVPAEQTFLLRSSRNLTKAKTSILEALHSAGIGVSGACRFMERECGGPQNLGFTRRDAYDHFVRKSKLQIADSIMLWNYFMKKSQVDPLFYWNHEKDDDGRLMNFFFRDGRSLLDYEAFSEVLSVDATYRTNKYNLKCVPFVGINHHRFTCMFGVGFLSDERTSSFEWLFNEFLVSMKGLQPKVIFTDQCVAMMNAIDKTFPESKHRLCQWHINENAPKHFGSLNKNAEFKKLWYKCMNWVETELEFDVTWKQLMSFTNPNSKSQKWFNAMHTIRHRWASVFTRDIFTAGLLSTSRSEGANRCVKAGNRRTDTLIEFVENYEKVKMAWRRRETEEDTKCIWLPGQLVRRNELFTQAASCYTRNVYKLFENEIMRSWNVVISPDQLDHEDSTVEICIQTHAQRPRRIIYNKDTKHASCSCRMWESEGLLCRHILKVYYCMNNFTIPESLILKRWTKKAKDGRHIPSIGTGTDMGSTLPNMVFFNTIVRHLYDLSDICLEREDCRSVIKDRVEALVDEIHKMTGTPKAAVDVKDDDLEDAPFGDPKKVVEKGFVHARKCRTLNSMKKKGVVKSKKRDNVVTHETNNRQPIVQTPETSNIKQRSTNSVPRVPFQVTEQFYRNPSFYYQHSAGWVPDEKSEYRRLSQP